MTPLARAQRLLFWVVMVVTVVLAGTGVWLTFNYRPDTAQAWTDLDLLEAGIDWARVVHRQASILLVPLLVAFLVVGAIAHRRWRAATALLVTTLALTYTGFLLPWDQLALWTVTVGSDYQGMLGAAFDDEVRFVLIGGFEISQATLRLWLLVHTVALTLLFVGLLVLAARSTRKAVSAVAAA